MPNASPTRILLVDDTEANRYVVSRHLRRAGYEVLEAGTGQDALRIIQTKPDLVILDVKLPDMNGIEISRMLRSQPGTRSLPILQLSATFVRSGDRIRGLDAGADAYLVSPVEPEELLAHVRTLLRLKATQEALENSNARLQSVLSNILDVFFAADRQLHVLELNPAAERFFGRPAPELLGQPLPALFPAGLSSPLCGQLAAAANHQQPYHFEAQSDIRPCNWYEGHAYPRDNRIEVYLRDITERKIAEKQSLDAAERLREHVQQLQSTQAELQAMQDQLARHNEDLEKRVRERTLRLSETINDLETFSYSITHDMRAPLRAMQGFARILVEDYAQQLPSDAAEYLQRIAGSAARLDLLIRDVLSYSNIIRAQLKLVPVDADRLLRDILREYPDLQPPKADILVPRPLPHIMGNEAFLTQCFSNLLNNAVKFVAPGVRPRVEITWNSHDERIRFFVKDNGIGIARHHQERLFDLFQRAHTQYPGTGVGLAVVRKAVERMGGSAGVESEAGTGSTFWFELNRTPQPAAAAT